MKNPANVIFGSCLKTRRQNLGHSSEVHISRTAGVTSSHWRLLESGATPCSASSTFILSRELRWSYAVLSELLVSLGHANVKSKSEPREAGVKSKSNPRELDKDAAYDRFLELEEIGGVFQPVWTWCHKGLDRVMKNDPAYPEKAILEWPDYSKILNLVFNILDGATTPSPHGDGFNKNDSRSPDENMSMVHKRLLEPFQNALIQMEKNIGYLVPVLEGAYSINYFIHEQYKKQLSRVDAYLSYRPDPKLWEKTEIDFSFLWRKGSEGQASPRLFIHVHGPDAIDADALAACENELNEIMRKRGNITDKKRKLIEVIPHSSTVHTFAYHFGKRRAYPKPNDESTLPSESLFKNLWVFHINKVGMCGFLDNFDQMGEDKAFEVGLSLRDTEDLLDSMPDT